MIGTGEEEKRREEDLSSSCRLLNFAPRLPPCSSLINRNAYTHSPPLPIPSHPSPSSLLKQEEELKVQLADLEKTLLETLANSTGNLLENKVLLDSLTETKVKSTTIATSLTDSKQLQLSLDKQREVYRPIAARGSAMYFLIK